MGRLILEGNLVTPLHNGAEIFPATLKAIEQAERSITPEIFVYIKGEIAQRFADALSDKARQGVKVHLLVDGIGLQLRDRLRASTDERRGRSRTALSDLLVASGSETTGKENASSPEEWRDSHYRVEGPVVAQMQAAILDNWMRTRAIALHGDGYFPA